MNGKTFAALVCLAAWPSATARPVVSGTGGLPTNRLIEFSPGVRRWMNTTQVDAMVRNGKMSNWMDVTFHPDMPTVAQSLRAFPDKPTHQDRVEALIENLDVQMIGESIEKMSSYFNRYYTTADSVEAAEWLEAQYKQAAGTRTDVTITRVDHKWAQPSLVVQVLGNGDSSLRDQPSDKIIRYSSDETVILGSHVDSTAGGAKDAAPGADDDASGSSTVLQVFRTLMAGDFRPERTVEFHAYAAEEAGLLGSQDIAAEYAAVKRNVVSMLQFDMVGYPLAIPEIGLIDDYTSSDMTTFVGKLIDEYTSVGHVTSRCGYACSDHASWNKVGYPSAFPFETDFGKHNPKIHTKDDTLANMNVTYAGEFAKFGLGYIIEMSTL